MDTVGADPNLQPSIALIANSIPRRHTTLVLIFVLFSFAFQAVAQLVATSRFTWALARESALPFSHFFRRLSKKDRLPLAAIWIVVLLAAPVFLLLCINVSIISTILLEGAGLSVMLSYAAPVALYLFCPSDALAGDGRAQWTLRSWSKPAAVAATFFSVVFTASFVSSGLRTISANVRSLRRLCFVSQLGTPSLPVRLVSSPDQPNYSG
jgi:amino acid transporter